MTIELAFSLLLGCGSRQNEPVHAPISTVDVVAVPTATNVYANASSVGKQNVNVDAPVTEARHVIIYVTETGSKYHFNGCSYLAKSCIPIDLKTTKQGYCSCSKRCPPR